MKNNLFQKKIKKIFFQYFLKVIVVTMVLFEFEHDTMVDNSCFRDN